MTLPQHHRSADVREATERQIRDYRLSRVHTSSAQREFLATQAAQLRSAVAAFRADLDAKLALSAAELRSRLHENATALRNDVNTLLQNLAASRSQDSTAAHEARTQDATALRNSVNALLQNLATSRSQNSATSHEARTREATTLRDSVNTLLQNLATSRSQDSTASHEARVQEFHQLREQVSAYIRTLSAERDSLATSQSAELRRNRQTRAQEIAAMRGAWRTARPLWSVTAAPIESVYVAPPATYTTVIIAAPDAPVEAPVAPVETSHAAPVEPIEDPAVPIESSVAPVEASHAAPVEPVATPVEAPHAAEGSDLMQRIGQVGLIAYAQMARVTILRALEGGTLDEEQERQIGAHIDGLVGNVQSFLTEIRHALGQLNSTERSQISEIVEGVHRNIVTLHNELEHSHWPTGPDQVESFRRLATNLRLRLAPIHGDLDAVIRSLQGDKQPVVKEPAPEIETPQPRSYRDNLTTIHGIGPAFQQRLDRAGICTYIQLALSSPEDLRKALGDAGRLSNVDDWIVQARSLAGLP